MGKTLVHPECEYERLVPIADILKMRTWDMRTDKRERMYSCSRVSQTLPTKRRDGGYTKLRTDIEQHGFRHPLFFEFSRSADESFLSNGHHRLAVAIDLGLTHVPVTTDSNVAWGDDDWCD